MVLLTRLSRAIYQRAKESALGVSLKEYSALSNLRYFPNLTQQALADTLHLDPNNLVLLLNALESDNLVERRRDRPPATYPRAHPGWTQGARASRACPRERRRRCPRPTHA